MKLVDTHIHLDLMEDPDALIEEARQADVNTWVVPGVAPGGWRHLLATVDAFAGLYAAPGVHPREAHSCGAEELESLSKILEHPRVVAIGEVGLDRQVDCSIAEQEAVFVEMIRLAEKKDKPLLIHSRRTMGRVLELLEREGGGRVKGVLHAFPGSVEVALQAINMNFLIGVGGVVTYATAKRLPQVVREVPETALVLETDAPDMTPEPFRGQPNRPAWLQRVAEEVAELRGWSLAETARITSANAMRLFEFPDQGTV